MNSRIVRIGLAAVAAAAFVVIGIVLLAGRGTDARLTPSSAQAQAPGLAAPVTSATAGGLDTSFGGDGKIVTNLTRRDDAASALAIQADGKIVVAGDGIARYNSDGTLDTSFSGDGKLMTGFGASAVAIQADGKIVVAGWAGVQSGRGPYDATFALARYNRDGTLDASFGVKGRVRTDFTAGWDGASGVAIQADGRIVVVGTAGSGPDTKFALARYNNDGTPDASFGGNGKVVTDFTAWRDGAKGVAIQADGRIVVVGIAGEGQVRVMSASRWARWRPRDAKFALARYNSDGTPDASFGVKGKVKTDFTSGSDSANGVAIQADGKIVAAGEAGNSSGRPKFALARYNSDGTLDASFGGGGKVMTYVSAWDAANGVAIQADGKIVAAGVAAANAGNFALARYDSDGTLDASFGVDGKVTTDFTPRSDGAAGVAIQADGRIVAAGWANSGRAKMKVALARYLAAAGGRPPTASPAGSPSPGPAATASRIGDGVYLVGTDIPAGLYRGTTVSDAGGFWQIASDASGSSLIAIAGTTAQFYVQVEQGQYLKLGGVQIVNAAAAAPAKLRSSVGDGVYLVGTDIPAGRYRGTMGFGDVGGSWQISRDANGTRGVHSADRPFYIHVKKGQYLDLFGLKVTRVK